MLSKDEREKHGWSNLNQHTKNSSRSPFQFGFLNENAERRISLNDDDADEAIERIKSTLRPGLSFKPSVAQVGVSNNLGSDNDKWLRAYLIYYQKLYSLLASPTNFKHYINVFEEDYQTISKAVHDAADRESKIVVGVKDLTPIVSSSDLMQRLVRSQVSVVQYYSRETSLCFHLAVKSLAGDVKNKPASVLGSLGGEKRKLDATKAALELKETIQEIEDSGKVSLRAIAEELTARSIPTPNNKQEWNAMTVKRMRERLKDLDKDSGTPEL